METEIDLDRSMHSIIILSPYWSFHRIYCHYEKYYALQKISLNQSEVRRCNCFNGRTKRLKGSSGNVLLMQWSGSYGLSMRRVLTFDCSAPTGPISIILLGTTEESSSDMSKITSDRQMDGYILIPAVRLFSLPLHSLYFIIYSSSEFTLEADFFQLIILFFVNSVLTLNREVSAARLEIAPGSLEKSQSLLASPVQLL